jgi:hypothetical protein
MEDHGRTLYELLIIQHPESFISALVTLFIHFTLTQKGCTL